MNERRAKNKEVRRQVEEVIERNGLKMTFISKSIGVENTTLSKWRNEVFDFKEEKLSKVIKFVSKYQ